MKRIRIVGLCLAAVFALSAVIAGTASAAPVLKPCVKTPKAEPATGEFSDKNCGKAEAGGKYKLGTFAEAKKTAFKIKGGKGKNFSWIPKAAGGAPYPGTIVGATACETEKGKGTFTETGATFKVEYGGCKNETKVCTTPTGSQKEKKGVIYDEELKGTLVDLPGGKVGLQIANAKTPGSTLAAYNCEGLEIDAVGGVIIEVAKGTTEASKALEFIAKAGPAGVQQQWTYTTLGEEAGDMETYMYVEELFLKKAPVAATPTLLFSKITGGPTLPSTQGSLSTTKGENFKIVG